MAGRFYKTTTNNVEEEHGFLFLMSILYTHTFLKEIADVLSFLFSQKQRSG